VLTLYRLYRRVSFFLSIVWRPCTGPNRDEPPMSSWAIWLAYGISVRTAWEVAGIIHGRRS
jgi:hypothetical protein